MLWMRWIGQDLQEALVAHSRSVPEETVGREVDGAQRARVWERTGFMPGYPEPVGLMSQ
jgi:hypothetical protein